MGDLGNIHALLREVIRLQKHQDCKQHYLFWDLNCYNLVVGVGVEVGVEVVVVVWEDHPVGVLKGGYYHFYV